MKRIYLTAIALSSFALSSLAMASCPVGHPPPCWLNGESADGMKTPESIKGQITAAPVQGQLPGKSDDAVKTSALPLDRTRVKLISNR